MLLKKPILLAWLAGGAMLLSLQSQPMTLNDPAMSVNPPPSVFVFPIVSGAIPSTVRSNFSGAVGLEFTVNKPIYVVALGRWVLSGNTASHSVELNTSGCASIYSTNVPTSGQLDQSIQLGVHSANLAEWIEPALLFIVRGTGQWRRLVQ